MVTVEIRCGAKKNTCRKLLAVVSPGSWDVDALDQPEFEKTPDGRVSNLWPRPTCPKHGRRGPVDLLHCVDIYSYRTPTKTVVVYC